MKAILEALSGQLIFWMAWIIIPLIMEIIPAVGGFFLLIKKRLFLKKVKTPLRLPEITLIVPVYNSSDTLQSCLASIYNSNYPSEQISIMLVNNGSTDNSFQVFQQAQKEFPTLSMQWLTAQQGKSKALNTALYNSSGKYIIHIDSDGLLEPHAIKNMVVRFEQNPNIHCLTGAVLTNPKQIDETKKFFWRLFRKNEFFEYCQAFLAGRNFESEMDNIYTLSGAFSAFRKSTILKTQLYNPDTVCEDTHVTFQVKRILNKSVHICENAIFFVEPIETFNKLYTQRQRWQRGEIEVSNMFYGRKSVAKNKFSPKKLMANILLYDHTFAFPRMIWYFALICLACLNYPMDLIIGSIIVIYLLYVLSAFLFYINVCIFLREFKEIQKYYAKKLYLVFILPLYNFIIFWIRFAGIINSIKRDSSWRTMTLNEELTSVNKIIRSDFNFLITWVNKLRKIINKD